VAPGDGAIIGICLYHAEKQYECTYGDLPDFNRFLTYGAAMLGYRMLYTVPSQGSGPCDVITLAMEQLHAWLRDKGYEADALDAGKTVSLASDVEGLLLERKEQDGSVATRTRIIEDTVRGRWTSELTVHMPGSRGRDPSVWLDIDDPSSTEDTGLPQQWTGTPRLARRLLGVMPAWDGSAQLTDRPIAVVGSDAEALVDVVCDPDRRGLVFIAGSEAGMPLPPWIDLVAQLLKDTIGLAAAYVLDSTATETLARALGESHAILPGTVRTFLPGADPASELDARRHRVLTTDRIIRGDGARVARLLGWKAREATLENPLPNAATRLAHAFENQLNTMLTDRLIIAEPPTSPGVQEHDDLAELADADHAALAQADETGIAEQASRYLALRDLTIASLGLDDLSASSLSEIARLAQLGRQAAINQAAVSDRLKDLQGRLANAEEARQDFAKRLEDEQLEHAETAQLGYETDRRRHYLERLLSKSDQAAAAWAPAPADAGPVRPESFDDLLAVIPKLDSIQFTGDPNITADLDEYDPLGTWAGKAWDALAALSDYAKASREGRCERDVDGYLRNPPGGCRTFPANRHARDESQDVQNNPRFRSARIFPVPTQADPSGRAFMASHFKIAQSGMISPRLHYIDDTAKTGMLYVGYIGRHLPTKQTN
jgi:hypothetical protein